MVERPEEPYLLQHLNLQLIVFKSSFYCLPSLENHRKTHGKSARKNPEPMVESQLFYHFESQICLVAMVI